MITAIDALLRVLLTTLGAAPVIHGGGSMTAVAVALFATALVALLLCAGRAPSSTQLSLVRPRRAIDVSALLAQSDPDAAGHARPRAPVVAASAA
ncbi:DUF6412 domain-containing protein [Microbacterium pygmaeum]|uniref:Uncharacterized protein n=1 Tax=Microbacterium pygmaeum TaxID=370764 RepID=A0A1G7WF40_9MICO|nr:DUF6412 domain-containing protein [Microbacterium pygmaeum]SDG70369.1 hypothetical protein SAMN04489810_1046 [Microbacterium pygmaeum]